MSAFLHQYGDLLILGTVAVAGWLSTRYEARQQRIEDAAKYARCNYGRGR